MFYLSHIWVSFSGVRFEVEMEEVKLSSSLFLSLKHVTIKLGSSNLARKYTHIFSFRKYTI